MNCYHDNDGNENGDRDNQVDGQEPPAQGGILGGGLAFRRLLLYRLIGRGRHLNIVSFLLLDCIGDHSWSRVCTVEMVDMLVSATGGSLTFLIAL